ncbi:MAG: XTP/dITP diphosphatase [Candidatus Thermoplasmatota archaeon]|nr:XTP/dITP diphosphatase [Candidatus Thermoplasmatota archaeon]
MELFFITTNRNKVEEARNILDSFEITQVDKEYPEIQSNSEGVVLFAMKYLKEREPFIIEDTSFCIKNLNGFPGAFASYVQKTIGNRGLLKLMDGVEERRALFETCIGLSYKGKRVFKGKCYGSIAFEPRGNNGFGFDPIFIPDGHNKTFAEMSLKEKNQISHRSKAFRSLKERLESII